jgi:DNA-nicking Smr family endonuclease
MTRRRRGLTPEEAELWSRVARSATPMHPDAKTAAPIDDKRADPPYPAPQPQPSARPGHPLPDFRIGQSVPAGPASHRRAPTPAERLAASPLRMDAKTHKRMSQGKLKPEARLDLHGMTLAEAHPELINFILSCQLTGCRLVLVITGKGKGDHGPLPTRPGALRHQVPIWLQMPPLAQAVQQIKAAHYRHGGEGAYYIYLRKAGR